VFHRDSASRTRRGKFGGIALIALLAPLAATFDLATTAGIESPGALAVAGSDAGDSSSEACPSSAGQGEPTLVAETTDGTSSGAVIDERDGARQNR